MKAGCPMKPLMAAAKSFRYFALRLFLDRKALFAILLVELACLAFCLIVAVSIGSNLTENHNPLDALPDAEYLEYCLSRYEQAPLGSAERGFFELIIDTGLRPNDFVAYTGENLLSAFSIENSDAYQVICFAPMAAVPPMYLLCYSLLGSPESKKAYKNAAESRIGARMFALGGIALYFALALLVICLTMSGLQGPIQLPASRRLWVFPPAFVAHIRLQGGRFAAARPVAFKPMLARLQYLRQPDGFDGFRVRFLPAAFQRPFGLRLLRSKRIFLLV